MQTNKYSKQLTDRNALQVFLLADQEVDKVEGDRQELQREQKMTKLQTE